MRSIFTAICRLRCGATALALASVLVVPAHAQFATSGPILPDERTWTEPSRDVAAADYRDAYCARWTDGCSTCERNSVNDQPSCQSVNSKQPACERASVRCEAVLRTIARVCLGYTDGCNTCVLRGCTAMGCNRPTDYRCTFPRRVGYSDPKAMTIELNGHWQLTNPQGRSCEILLGHTVTLTASCVDFGEPITLLKDLKVAPGPIVQLVRANGEVLLAFDATNLDELSGIERATGYRLVRLAVEQMQPWEAEGAWQLRVRDGSVCNLYLTSRTRRFDNAVEIMVPHAVSFTSRCISPDDANSLRLSFHRTIKPADPRNDTGRRSIFAVTERFQLPLWTSWQLTVHELSFRDAAGHSTVFSTNEDRVWRTEVQAGNQKVQLQLLPKR